MLSFTGITKPFLVVAASLVFSLAAAGSAQANAFGLSKPTAISTTTPTGDPKVSIGDFGNGVVAWPAQGYVYARLRSEEGTLSPVSKLGTSSTCLDSDVAGNGTSAVAWTSVTLKVAVAPLHGKFGRVRSLPTGPGCGEFKVVQTDNRTVLIWQSGTQIWFSIANGGGAFSPATLLDDARSARLDATHSADDSVLVAYHPQWASTPWNRTQIAIKRLAANSTTFSARQIVSSDTAANSESGTLGFFNGANQTSLGFFTEGGGPWLLREARLQTDGQMTIPTTAGSISYNAVGGYASFEGPYLAPLNSGKTIAAWVRSVSAGYENDYPKESVLNVTTGTPGTAFASERAISTPRKIAECPAISSLGDSALLAWQERTYTGPTSLPKTRTVKIALVDEFGNWTNEANIGTTSFPSSKGPSINRCRTLKAANDGSSGVLVWVQTGRLMLARFGVSFP